MINSREIPSTKARAVVDIERSLDVAISQRKGLGNMGADLDHQKMVDIVNDCIISLQIQYEDLTGGFYTPK